MDRDIASKENTRNKLHTKLSKDQREAVGLLSIGTFLEYFDLMLYVHMAVLLNELFFPKTDPHTASLISAFGFCSTYLLRPFGAILFGYIGDKLGRKVVVVITTFSMAVSSGIMSMAPTYAQIGITAAWIVTIIRMVQGMVASAEARGAEIYLTETIEPPSQYAFVAIVTIGSALGTSAALGVSSFFTSKSFDGIPAWRGAFLVGAIVALVGAVARTTLKESNEFSNKIAMMKSKLSQNNISLSSTDKSFLDSQNPSTKTSLYYFFTQCARPPCFYFIYIYCGDLLKNEFALSAAEIIHQNFLVSIIDFFGIVGLAFLSYKMHPLKILKAKFYLFFGTFMFFPYMLQNFHTTTCVFIFQSLAALFVFDHVPATPIFYKYFPVLKRFTYTGILSAAAKLSTYFITSFGLVYATREFSYYGMFIVFIPCGVLFYIAVDYFQNLEASRQRFLGNQE